MKILVAVSEENRITDGADMVRVPAVADCPHKADCPCRTRWRSATSGNQWIVARVVEPPGCFTLRPSLDTPETRRMLQIAAELPLGTLVKLRYNVIRAAATAGGQNQLLAYVALVVGPN